MSELSHLNTKRIPTNIITGFLGVGKTTAIRHLLSIKPAAEVWAVLLNEFGEIGIDGALLKTANAHIREVPGGCICCVAGLPMKIALNMMIAKTKPDRILIEPTGLGHPEEIIHTLTGEYYDSVLDVRAAITLVDPRKLSDGRFVGDPIFQGQIAAADVLVANKIDLANELDLAKFHTLAAEFQPPKAAAFAVIQGQVQSSWLNLPRCNRTVAHSFHQAGQDVHRLNPQRSIYNGAVQLPPGQDFIKRENTGQGFFSCGWLFQPHICFDFNCLFDWLSGADCLRVKGVMNTDQGIYVFNAEAGVLTASEFAVRDASDFPKSSLTDSRIEFIHDRPFAIADVEAQLMAARKHCKQTDVV